MMANLPQFLHQMLQSMLVGFTVGMTRTVLLTMAESEFSVEQQSFLFIASFVAVLGFVKAVLNFVVGALSERVGQARAVLGWLVALPIPPLIYFAPSWGWIVGATALLGVNKG